MILSVRRRRLKVVLIVGTAAMTIALASCGGSPRATPSSSTIISSGVHARSTSLPPDTFTKLLTHSGFTNGSVEQRIWKNGSILVPVGWVEHDQNQGQSFVLRFQDPGTANQLVVSSFVCELCETTPSGQPAPKNYLPGEGVFETQLVSPYRLVYKQWVDGLPNLVTNGLIVDRYQGSTPSGTITVGVTLPLTQTGWATLILNSLQT
jgi:hypothetical protein